MRDDQRRIGYGFCTLCGRKINYHASASECAQCDVVESIKYELLNWLRLQNRRRKNARLKNGSWGKGWLTESLIAALTQGATKNDWSLGKKGGKGVWKKLRYEYGGPRPEDDVSQLPNFLAEDEPAEKDQAKKEAK